MMTVQVEQRDKLELPKGEDKQVKAGKISNTKFPV